jgi:hypothetical protein
MNGVIMVEATSGVLWHWLLCPSVAWLSIPSGMTPQEKTTVVSAEGIAPMAEYHKAVASGDPRISHNMITRRLLKMQSIKERRGVLSSTEKSQATLGRT